MKVTSNNVIEIGEYIRYCHCNLEGYLQYRQFKYVNTFNIGGLSRKVTFDIDI